jgi:hypothetical protein
MVMAYGLALHFIDLQIESIDGFMSEAQHLSLLRKPHEQDKHTQEVVITWELNIGGSSHKAFSSGYWLPSSNSETRSV